MSAEWSDDELRESVEAYVDMLRKHHTGVPFSKKNYYKRLSEKYGRTVGAFEYRMQNISYVRALMGREWIPGLLPAKNL